MAKNSSGMWVVVGDLHYPHINKKTWTAIVSFLKKNKGNIAGFVFLGDQFNNDCISHHTRGKPMLRDKGAYTRETKDFVKLILDPLDELLKGVRKVWIEGNHDFWEQELVEQQPELDGIQRGPSVFDKSHKGVLELESRGWQFVPCGHRFKLGKLNFIHGEQLSGVGNQASGTHSKKAVEIYCGSVVYGHMHSPQSHTKVLPHDTSQKWMSYCLPIAGDVNPHYLRNRPTAWLNGFGIVEVQDNGNFNVYTVVTINGRFRFGGVEYGK